MHAPPLVFAVEGGRRCLRALYPLINADAPTTWMQLAMEGTWEGHQSGPFSFDRSAFAQIVANFERNPNPAPLDYEHATEIAIPAPAAGWIQRLEVRNSSTGTAELWALVELTQQAADYIRNGEYRFTSGVFDFESIDSVTGAAMGISLPSAALTNLPFLTGMRPVALSRRLANSNGVQTMYEVDKAELISRLRKLDGDTVSPEQAQKLTAALGMLAEALGPAAKPEMAPEEEPKKPEDEKPADEAAAKLTDKPAEKAAASAALSAVQGAPAAPVPAPAALEAAPMPEAPPAADPAAGGDAGALAAQLMEMTGLDMAALAEALKQMLAGGMPAATAPLSARIREHELSLSARDHTIRALSQRAESAEAEVKVFRTKEADHAVDVLIDSGRLLDSARSDMRELYLSNRKQFDSLSAALPEVVPVGKHADAMQPPTEKTPAIDETDPVVKNLRRLFSNTRLTKSQQDAAIVKRLADTKASQTRV